MSSKGFGTRKAVIPTASAPATGRARLEDSRLKIDLPHLVQPVQREPEAPVASSVARHAPAGLTAPVGHTAFAAPTAAGFSQNSLHTPAEFIDPRQILTSIGEVVYTWDIATDFLSWGPNVSEVLAFAGQDILATGAGYAELLSPDSPSSRFSAVKDAEGVDSGAGVPFQVHYSLKMPDNSLVWIEDTGRWFVGSRGEPAYAHGVVRRANEHYDSDMQRSLQSRTDRLTGAITRDELSRHLSTSLESARKEQKAVAVLLASIDNLGQINRAYGYDVADEVISGLAKSLRGQMRGTDVLARYSGNKFAFVLESCDPDQLSVAVRRFLTTISKKPVETSVGPLFGSLRFGGCIAPRNGRTQQVLLQHAEEALEMAKTHASERFVTYTESLVRQEARSNAGDITREITQALHENRLELALQPIIEAASGNIAFYEALIRMRRPDGTVVQPDTFLPTAERVGLIQLLDQRTLELVVKVIRQQPNIHVAFNVSATTAHDPEWPLRLKLALAHNPQDAKRLIVEITETFAVDNMDTTNRVIEEMKAVGVSVAMDDFGSGHTSFRGLRRLNFDVIKIDGAFIQNLARSADDRIFVRALVDLAKHIGVPIVAEWVEDEETARILSEWGVTYLQGHYFGRAELVSELPAQQRDYAKTA